VVSGVAQSIDGIVTQLEPQVSEVGPLIAEARLAMATLQRASERLENGEGTLGRLMEDPALYEETQAAISTLRRLMADMQANPAKYIGAFKLF
jgi:phospholipid/cholesterol/gamma-HCH transport system substrate-binding protein